MVEKYAERLESYLDALVPPRPGEMEGMEQYAAETGFPIVGPASGQFCYLIARLVAARRVFEMGSGYGYSTAWFARAVQENGGGEVFHTVWDAQLSERARGHLANLGFAPANGGSGSAGSGVTVHYQPSEAVQALRETPGPFDLIFNDIDKQAYPSALPLIYEKLRPGGVLLVDNLLWHGRIFDKDDNSPATQAIRAFTHLITTSPEWVTSIVPIRDGLLLAYKR